MADKPIGVDATGYDILTDAMKALLNQYPGLHDNEIIKFEELGKESGIAFSADNGALIYSEKEDVCGVMHQVCQVSILCAIPNSIRQGEAEIICSEIFG